ncbi:hypothetical protein BJV82DRAFT_534313, partial [Fennellomyces sp. T-0311]
MPPANNKTTPNKESSPSEPRRTLRPRQPTPAQEQQEQHSSGLQLLTQRLEDYQQNMQDRLNMQQNQLREMDTNNKKVFAENAAIRAENQNLQEQLTQLLADYHSTKKELEDARALIQQLQRSAADHQGSQQPGVHVELSPSVMEDMDLQEESEGLDKSRHAPSAAEQAALTRRLQQQRQHQEHQRQHQQHRPAPGPASYAKMASKNISSKTRRFTKSFIKAPTAAMVAWAGRGFQPVNSTAIQGYTFVYLNSPHRMPHSEVRKRLRILGIAQARIIDVHFPTTGVVGLLIHRSYEQELTELLKKGGISTTNFNPLAATVIQDPKLETITEPEKIHKATTIHQTRILRTCLNMPHAYLGHAILRYFSDDSYEGVHKVGRDLFAEFVQQRPPPARRQRQLTTAEAAAAFNGSPPSTNQQQQQQQ